MKIKQKLFKNFFVFTTLCGCLGACAILICNNERVLEVKAETSDTYRLYFDRPKNGSVWANRNPDIWHNGAWYSMTYDHASPNTTSFSGVYSIDIPNTTTCIRFGAPNESTIAIYNDIVPGKVWYLAGAGTSATQIPVGTYNYNYTVNITFDSNGGSSNGSATYHYGYDITSKPFDSFTHASADKYHTLLGYYTSASGGTKVINSDGTICQNVKGFTDSKYWIKTNTNLTLYVQWKDYHFHDGIEFTKWSMTNSFPTAAGNYYLAVDIDIPYSSANYAWTVRQGVTNLCLNGHTIKLNSVNYNGPSAFYVGAGATLKIFDCNETEATTHYFKFYRYTDWAPASYANNAITIDQITPSTADGTIIKIPGGAIFDASNFRGAYGGAIQVDGNTAHLYLNGGNIVGSYCSYGGGAIAVINGASFEMNGGRIVGNCGYEAGGVFITDYCSVTINNGFIGYNVAHTTYGGGIASFGTVTMNGGSITSNSTINYDGQHNRSGGGVFISKNQSSSTFTMNGGTISNNYSGTNGGGVYIDSGSSFIMKDGSIKNNCSNLYGGGIENFATFSMEGGSILNNYTINNGGGGIDNNGTTKVSGGTIQGNNCNDGIGHQIRNPSASATISGYCNIDNARNSLGNYDLYYVTNNITKTKLNLNKEYGEESPSYVDVLYNQQIPSSVNIPTKDFYTFNGFYTGTNGTCTQYYNNQGVRVFTSTSQKIVAEINLYANWIKTVKDFAEEFINLTDGFCTASKDSVISTLKASFDSLSYDDKQLFIQADVVIGRIEFTDNEVVVNAKSRYCYMISDFGYDDFLDILDDETLKALRHEKNITYLFDNSEENTSIILVTCISILTLTTFGAYFALRKRKHN